jgi:hypothetical protein
MQTAIWLAMIFGPFLAIVGLWMLLYSDNLLKTYASIKGTPAVMYMRSVVNMLLGLTIITQYNMWQWDGSLLVTLLGWVLFIRGVITLYVPQFVMKLGMSDQKALKYRGVIPLIWGLALCWFAFG